MIGVIGRLRIVSILLVLLLLASFGLWWRIASERWGSRLSAPVVLVVQVIATMSALAVTPLVGIDFGWVLLAGAAVSVVIGGFLVARDPARRRRPGRDSVALWASASLGAVAWIATRIAAEVVPGASAVGWAMEGDATNNLNYARRILAENGISVGSTANPVPLPASAVAVPLGVDGLAGSGGGLAAQLVTYGWVWVAVFAVLSVTMGVVAASLVDPERRGLVAVTASAGSLLPLTWFVGGLPIDFGYFNMPFTIVLALASWLLYVNSPRAPRVAFVAMVLTATLLALAWTPIALVPAALGVVLVVRDRRALVSLRGWRLVACLVALAAALGWVVILTLPTYFAQNEALDAHGQDYPPPWTLALALVGVSLVTAALLRTRLRIRFLPGLLALVGALYAAVAVFLFLARNAFDPWTGYYPVKGAWIACVILLPVVLSLVASLGSLARPRAAAGISVTIVSALVVALAAFAPVTPARGFPPFQPGERMLGGHVWKTGDEAVDVITSVVGEAADTGETPILWMSDAPDEQMVNFWTIYSLDTVEPGDRALRRFAFREYGAFRSGGTRGPSSFNTLCALMRDPARSIVVYTDDASTQSDFAERCTDSSAEFVLGATPGIDY